MPAPPPRIGFVSLGCPKALVDSERILTRLRAEGYDVVGSYEDANLVVVNTCGFIDDAVHESLDAIGEALARNGTQERLAVVEPGVINLDVSKAAAPYGLYYAPDPSSQPICTIGGNVAFNSGGAHCLKYSMTSNHVLGLKVVLPDGEVVQFGGESLESVGPDLVGLFVGSDGLFGIALEITLRLLPKPELYRTVLAAYHSLGQAEAAIRQYTRVEDRFADARQAIEYFARNDIRLPEVVTIQPGMPCEVELTFRNVPACSVRVYRIDLMKFSLLRRDLSDITNINLSGIRPYYQATIELGNGKDYRDRTTPLKLPLKGRCRHAVYAEDGRISLQQNR